MHVDQLSRSMVTFKFGWVILVSIDYSSAVHGSSESLYLGMNVQEHFRRDVNFRRQIFIDIVIFAVTD